MIISRLKNLVKFNKAQNKKIIEQNSEIILQNKELIWAHIFHDAIKGRTELVNLPLNVGRWAGNYTLFYILFRILNDYKPKKILELGLGESSKFISVFIKNYLKDSMHLVIEQDETWKDDFLTKFNLSKNSEIIISPLKKEIVRDNNVKVYKSLGKGTNQKFDFYFIDGPHGSKKFSRYDAFKIVRRLEAEDDFLLLLDDYDRVGEKETANLIFKELQKKGMEFHKAEYHGIKSILIIGSSRYKEITNF
ncbi:hypothetical protein [Gramella sp. MAR_2010_147]|uniref:hypothetical protein n=1 Tax=Gramella sp. MAR_2010_147 TaxID=1250205 RepID=UPI00087CD495|nr:hypothetical protein [Gramella sp. MAR_2010_147]SDS02308.1 hypothetical protein SAMN04488553_1285 [Gramella sp. MAR_2010_147]